MNKEQFHNLIIQMTEEEVLARTLYGEARGECRGLIRESDGASSFSLQGIVAVGCVIMNRVAAQTWYGSSIRRVCLKPYQFSCWNEKDPNLMVILTADARYKIYRACVRVARDLIAGRYADVTGGADHYYALYMKDEPSWVRFARETTVIGRHRFFKALSTI